MKVRVKKLFHGLVSIRDYLVKQTKQKNENLYIEYKNKVMTIYNKDLDKGTTNNYIFWSKHNDRKYKLIDYSWIPDKLQQELFI